jgi:hypothetical protein
MEKIYLEKHFVFKLYSAEGCPLEETSELGYRYNKGTISIINCVIVIYIFLSLC